VTIALAILFGLIFGAGLLLSGMTDPARVIGFLDIAGAWDPSLAFVMGGAVIAAAPFFLLSRSRARPILAMDFESLRQGGIDAKLVGGAAIFGVGWGMAGLCPGPALVVFGLNPSASCIFLASMIAGLILGGGADFAWPGRRPETGAATSPPSP
jgi:uncharacterized membrane protein YedE/YeeE